MIRWKSCKKENRKQIYGEFLSVTKIESIQYMKQK